MTVDVAPQVGHDPLAQPGDEIGAQVGGDRQDHDDQAHGQEGVVEGRGLTLAEAPVDQVTQADAQGQHRGRGQDQGDQRPDDMAAVGPEIGGEPAQLTEVAGAFALGPEPCQRAGALLHRPVPLAALSAGTTKPLPRPLSSGAARRYIPAAF